MKKINSINYGEKVLGVGLLCMFLIPGIMLWSNMFFECWYIDAIAKFSSVIGAGILICFAGLLLIEFQQDKRLDRYYSTHKNVKIKLINGKYECGACGSRAVDGESTFCKMCGCKFE